MRSDLISTSDIVIEYNSNISLPYSSLMGLTNLSFHTPSMDSDTIIRKSAQTYNINEIDELFKMGSPNTYSTEIKHLKASFREFAFVNELGIIKYNENNAVGFSGRTAANYVIQQTIKNLVILADRDWFQGTSKNAGLRNNPDAITENIATEISTQTQINRIFSDMKYALRESGVTDTDRMVFLWSGKELATLFDSPSGSNGNIMDRLPIQPNQLFQVSSLVDNPEDLGGTINGTIIGMLPEFLMTHLGAFPQLLDTGTNNENRYDFHHFLRTSVGLESTNQGSIIINNFTVNAEPA